MSINYVRFILGASIASLLGISAIEAWAVQPKKVVGVVDKCCTKLVDIFGHTAAIEFSLKEQPGVKYQGWFDSPAEAEKMGVEGL